MRLFIEIRICFLEQNLFEINCKIYDKELLRISQRKIYNSTMEPQFTRQ